MQVKLRNIPIEICFESKTNPRGDEFEDKEFEELKASIKEKGILVPILVRQRTLLRNDGKVTTVDDSTRFEVIAGNRRFRAAKQLALKEVPAKIVEMTDEEALEAQIIENLQRKDIHPIEEGLAYRVMRENKMTSKEIAEKIGKSERYVRYRLNLTNLIESAQKAFRAGKINDSLAVLISDLAPSYQKEALKYCLDPFDHVTAKDLKEWITRTVYEPLKNQPWLASKELMVAVGECKECPPARQSLFGDVKEGACTDLRCWTRKMNNYIKIKKEEWKNKGVDLVEISSSYGRPEKQGVISKSDYETVSKKCGHQTRGIVVEGRSVGEILTICIDPECPVHAKEHSEYVPSAKEKENRKKEREKAKKEKIKNDEDLLSKIEMLSLKPFFEIIDPLLQISFKHAGFNVARSICKRHKIEVKKDVNEWGGSFDYDKALKNWIKGGTANEKLKLALELLIDSGYGSFNVDLKKL